MKNDIREIHDRHLREPAVAEAYINEAINEAVATDDIKMLLMAVNDVARAQDKGSTALAACTQLRDDDPLESFVTGNGSSLANFTKIIHGLGFRLQVAQDSI